MQLVRPNVSVLALQNVLDELKTNMTMHMKFHMECTWKIKFQFYVKENQIRSL